MQVFPCIPDVFSIQNKNIDIMLNRLQHDVEVKKQITTLCLVAFLVMIGECVMFFWIILGHERYTRLFPYPQHLR